jgi:hypothetical protein
MIDDSLELKMKAVADTATPIVQSLLQPLIGQKITDGLFASATQTITSKLAAAGLEVVNSAFEPMPNCTDVLFRIDLRLPSNKSLPIVSMTFWVRSEVR